MKKLLMISCLLVTMGLITGCATVEGFGEDVSSTGFAIQGAAEGY
jgi:predicted small secreted protein